MIAKLLQVRVEVCCWEGGIEGSRNSNSSQWSFCWLMPLLKTQSEMFGQELR